MNAQKLTQKSIEAVQSAQDIAIEYQNNAIEPEHLMYSLLNQENGLIPQLMTKMNIEVFSDGSELWDDIASGKNKDGAGKFYGKLNNIEKQLVDSKIPFLRIHQSYLVNYRFICKIIFYHVTYL